MRQRVALLLLTGLIATGCSITVPISALIPDPQSGTWQLKGSSTTDNVTLTFRSNGDIGLSDGDGLSDARFHRWSKTDKTVDFARCGSSGCKLYHFDIVDSSDLKGYAINWPPAGDDLNKETVTATFKADTGSSSSQPSSGGSASTGKSLAPTPNPSASTVVTSN